MSSSDVYSSHNQNSCAYLINEMISLRIIWNVSGNFSELLVWLQLFILDITQEQKGKTVSNIHCVAFCEKLLTKIQTSK